MKKSSLLVRLASYGGMNIPEEKGSPIRTNSCDFFCYCLTGLFFICTGVGVFGFFLGCAADYLIWLYFFDDYILYPPTEFGELGYVFIVVIFGLFVTLGIISLLFLVPEKKRTFFKKISNFKNKYCSVVIIEEN